MTHQHQRKCWAVTVLVGPLLWALLMAGMSVGCSGDEVVYEGLHLWITSEEPTPHVPIDRIVITVRDVDDDGSVLLFEELSEQDHVREILLGEQYNIYDAPYKAKFVSGEIIGGVVRMALTGFHGDQTISSWTGNVSLDENYKREVVLQLISQSTCTEDADCVAPRSCQIGICEPDSECIFPLKEDYCLIDGTCYLTGSGSVNDLCEVCDTAQSNMELVAVTCPQDMVCQSEKGCVPVGNTCVDLDCDDEDPCTLDTCQDNTCVNAAIENCCTEVADCIPTECQTLIVCDANNTCVYESTCCLSDDECDDGNVCTMNSCEEKDCAFAPIADCCNHAEDCDDASLCTLDDCVDNACHFANIENCCIKAGDCDDATNCSDDTCVNNQCVNDSTNCCGNVSDCPSPQACEQVTCSPAGDCKYQTQSVCTPGTTQNQFCGKCGTQTQACTDQCDWGLFGACQGQGPCSSGQTQECGLGGTQSCTEACTWGACEGEGDCANGATKTCGDCGQSVCANNAWGPCKSQGKCSAGQTLLCGQCGSQTCQANCQWALCQPDNSLCNDSNPCTKNKCVEGACLNPNKTDGIVCDADSNGCTGNDACLSGVCQAGETPTCDDGLACTVDACLSTGSNSSICVTDLKEEHCLIDGQCYNNAESFGIGCSVCDPATSQTSPTPLNNGNDCISCLNGGHCNTEGGCSSSLECDDLNDQTSGDECMNGACTGTPVVKVDNQTCNTIKNTDPTATNSGVYTIDTDKDKKNKPFQAYCDMTTQGGGWTLVWKQRNHDDAVTLNKPKLKGSALLLSESYDGTTQGSIMGAVPHGETLLKHDGTTWIHVEESILDWSKLNSGPSNKRTCRNIGETTHTCEGIDCSIYKHVFLDRTDPPMKNGQVSGIIIGPFHDNYGTGDWLQCGEVWCHPAKHGRFDEGCTDGTPDGKGDWMIFVR